MCKENNKLKWAICLSIEGYWSMPDISDIEFEGEERVEQKLWAEDISTQQVLDVMEDYCLIDNTNTIGLLHGGLMMDALSVHNSDDKSMYIAPYFPDRYANALKNLQLLEVPVLQDNMHDVKPELMDIDNYVWSQQEWASIIDAIAKLQEEGISYDCDERQEQADSLEQKIIAIYQSKDNKNN